MTYLCDVIHLCDMNGSLYICMTYLCDVIHLCDMNGSYV